ncbi:MAG: protein-disulfide reductase DsbD domain-containing protein [Chitinophagaceae bacterium]
MKSTLLLGLFLMAGYISKAQSDKMVKWNYTVKKVAEKTYEVHMTANIEHNFHMYAQNVGVEGPLPTTFTFTKSPAIILDGKVKEQGKLIRKFESAWNGNASYYEKNVNFIQVVKLKHDLKTNFKGKVEFMVCDDKKCLLPSNIDINVNVGG